MCCPCRVVHDSSELLALFIAAGSVYKARPKKTAAEKRHMRHIMLPPDEYVWRKGTLRLMLPGCLHSVLLVTIRGRARIRAFDVDDQSQEQRLRRLLLR